MCIKSVWFTGTALEPSTQRLAHRRQYILLNEDVSEGIKKKLQGAH